MQLNNETIDTIYEYVNGEHYLFYSESMCGKTNAQFDYLVRYLYNNGGNALVLCKNRDTIDKIVKNIDKYNNPYKLVKYIYPNEIYFGDSYIRIIGNDDFLRKQIRGNNFNVLFVDDFNLSFKQNVEDIKKMSMDLRVNDTKIILNGTITNNNFTNDRLNALKTEFKFKEVNGDFIFHIKRRCKIEKIKKRIK